MERLDNKAEEQLGKLQRQIFNFFWNEANPVNGLVPESTAPDCPASIAATGFALTSYPVAVERGFVARDAAAERAVAALRFFHKSRIGPEPEATGFHGFYYSLLDINKGRRVKMSEVSVLDTSILLAGVLTAGTYFRGNSPVEDEIRSLAEEIFAKADWHWALNTGDTLVRGWKPETGFSRMRYEGYDEAFLSYILAAGSPEYPLPDRSFPAWSSSYEWLSIYGHEYLYAGPFFVHQLPHAWIDFRNIADDFMRNKGTDYFANSVNATMVQYKYALENPGKFEGYGQNFWGITTSDGPGPCTVPPTEDGRRFFGHARRGAPFGPDDGTVTPWSAIASLPFAPEIVLQMIDHLFHAADINMPTPYGFKAAHNPTYPHKRHNPHGWRSPWNLAFIQGPALALVENFRTGFIWKLLHNNQFIVRGLDRLGFSGGWLAEKQEPVLQHAGNQQ